MKHPEKEGTVQKMSGQRPVYNEKMKELYSLRRKLKDKTRGQGDHKDSSDSNSSNRAGGEGGSMDTTTNE